MFVVSGNRFQVPGEVPGRRRSSLPAPTFTISRSGVNPERRNVDVPRFPFSNRAVPSQYAIDDPLRKGYKYRFDDLRIKGPPPKQHAHSKDEESSRTVKKIVSTVTKLKDVAEVVMDPSKVIEEGIKSKSEKEKDASLLPSITATHTVTELEQTYASMIRHSHEMYDANKLTVPLPPNLQNYEVLRDYADNTSYLYRNKETNELVLSIRGTKPTNPNDWVINAMTAVGVEERHNDVTDQIRKIKRIENEFGLENLKVVSYSKGTSIGLAIAREFGVKGTHFNPWLGPNAIDGTYAKKQTILRGTQDMVSTVALTSMYPVELPSNFDVKTVNDPNPSALPLSTHRIENFEEIPKEELTSAGKAVRNVLHELTNKRGFTSLTAGNTAGLVAHYALNKIDPNRDLPNTLRTGLEGATAGAIAKHVVNYLGGVAGGPQILAGAMAYVVDDEVSVAIREELKNLKVSEKVTEATSEIGGNVAGGASASAVLKLGTAIAEGASMGIRFTVWEGIAAAMIGALAGGAYGGVMYLVSHNPIFEKVVSLGSKAKETFGKPHEYQGRYTLRDTHFGGHN